MLSGSSEGIRVFRKPCFECLALYFGVRTQPVISIYTAELVFFCLQSKVIRLLVVIWKVQTSVNCIENFGTNSTGLTKTEIQSQEDRMSPSWCASCLMLFRLDQSFRKDWSPAFSKRSFESMKASIFMEVGRLLKSFCFNPE